MRRSGRSHSLLLRALLAIACAGALSKCHAAGEGAAASRIVLENGGFRAEVAPGLGGRVSFYAAAGGSNALWFAEAAVPMDGWLNHGGEKTWIGPQSLWKSLSGKGWPPPAFFDQARYEVVRERRGRHSVTLESPAGAGGGLRLSRTIELLDDGALSVSSRLICTHGGDSAVPVGELRLWSVVQIPLPERVEVVPESGKAVVLVPSGEKRLQDALPAGTLAAVIGESRFSAQADAAEGATAAVYFTGTNAPPPRRYAELEFSVPAAQGLAVRYRLSPPEAAPPAASVF